MLITRSGILREVLEEKNREMHRYSKHEAGLEPIEGYEKHFEDLRKTCELLRGMIRNAEDRERENNLADWQMDIIKGQQPGVEWADKVPQQTVDEMVLRRRYRKAEGFKPEPVMKTDASGVYVNGEKVLPKPVVYPGGEE